MFRNQLSAEIILGAFCLMVGTILLGFVSMFVDNGRFEAEFRQLNREEMLIFGSLFLAGVICIVCSYGLFKHKRWAVIFMSLMLLIAILIVAFTIYGEGSFFLRRPLQATITLLSGIGLPLCLLLLFNSTRVFPWLAKLSDGKENDILDEL